MMKKISIAFLLIFTVTIISAQKAYYWRGSATGGAWTTNSNWNLALDGSSTSRNTPNAGDTLIFDGNASNFIGTSALSPAIVSAVPYQTIKNLVFRNGAFVKFTSSPGTASVGSTTVGVFVGTQPNATGQTITGTGTDFTNFFALGDFVSTGTANTGTGGTNSIGQITAITSSTSLTQTNGALAMIATAGSGSSFLIKDAMVRITGSFSVDASSYVEMGSTAPLILKLNEGVKGDVYGTINISTNFQKIAVVDSNSTAALTFYNGSKFQFTGSQSSAPFDGLANANNNNVIFKYGSVYENNSTTAATANSCGSLYGAIIPYSVVSFEKGSTYVQNSNTASSMFASAYRSLPNVILNGSTSVMRETLIVDTLTVNSNTNWTNASNSYFPIKGDFIINGTYTGAATTPVFVFCGNGTQNIKVTGSVATGGFNKIIVAPTSTLKLGSNIIQSTSSTSTSYTRVFGTINFDTYSLLAASTTSNTLQGYNPATATAKDSIGVVSASTPNLITFPIAIAGLQQGMQITGDDVPSNTVIVVTSGTTVTTSNPIKPGTSVKVSTNVSPSGSTFITANANGINGSYPNTPATFTLPTSNVGSNFTFNAATTTPFPVTTNVYANNLTLAGNVASNATNLYVAGTLNLNNNTLTIPEADTVRVNINTGGSIQGASSSKFIALGVNTTTGARGALKIDSIGSPIVFPIGVNGNYLPVTITPAGGKLESYTVSAFNGATANALPNGTAFDATKKAAMVDAVWTIKANTTPLGAVGIQFGWPASLEGSSFSSYANNQIGIATYTTDWGAFASANADNSANTASSNFTSFGAFTVGLVNSTLPVKFTNIAAQIVNGSNKITWQVATEIAVSKYVVEASSDGVHFTEKGFVAATGAYNYSFVDIQPTSGDNYYRVYALDNFGAITYSSVVKLSNSNVSISSVSIYPNPVVNRTVNVGLNNLPIAAYTVQITDGFGKTIATKFVNHLGGTSNYAIELPQSLAVGNYYITVKDLTKVIVSKSILVK